MRVVTGFGYIKDDKGNIVTKAQLPAGEHPLKVGFEYVEVADLAALAAVVLYRDSAEAKTKNDEKLIQQKMRQLAVDALKAEGKL